MDKDDDNVTNPNASIDGTPEEPIDQKRRRFLQTSACVLGGVGALCALTPFVSSWLPSAKTRADGGPIEVDLSHLEPGQRLVVEWRGKPIWIIRRTAAMLEQLHHSEPRLRDPLSKVEQQPAYAKNVHRSIKPDILVLVGICTHLGCVPHYKPSEQELGPDWPGGFYCPCHGSSFDLAGRVFKSVPAPINLEVPPHRFVSEHLIIIGEDEY